MDTPGSRPPLGAEREQELARRIEAGVVAAAVLVGRWPAPAGVTADDLAEVRDEGEQARQDFLLGNVRLVWWAVRQSRGRTRVSAEELFQEGFTALAESLERYDHRIGRFSTYALPRVRDRLAAVTSTGMGALGLPAYLAIRRQRALALAGELGQVLGAEPTADRLAEAMGRPRRWVEELLRHGPPLGLEQVAEPSVGHDAEERLLWGQIEACLARLPGPGEQVLRLRHGLRGAAPLSYREVAAVLGCSVSQVRRIEATALVTLRARLGLLADAG